MRKIIMGLALALLTLPAAAQTAQDFDACQSEDNPDAAIAGCTAIIASGRGTPDNLAGVYGERGFAYYAKGLYEQAAADFSMVISNWPDDGSNYALRGLAYQKGGHRDQAIADFQTTLRLSAPDSDEAKAARTQLKALGVSSP